VRRGFIGLAGKIEKPNQKIAAFGSSYMEMRSPVGAAEGCDLSRLPTSEALP
jgi:hypothetical protein